MRLSRVPMAGFSEAALNSLPVATLGFIIDRIHRTPGVENKKKS
jgi:hypothetical protein